jgi:hypothetical protein
MGIMGDGLFCFLTRRVAVNEELIQAFFWFLGDGSGSNLDQEEGSSHLVSLHVHICVCCGRSASSWKLASSCELLG